MLHYLEALRAHWLALGVLLACQLGIPTAQWPVQAEPQTAPTWLFPEVLEGLPISTTWHFVCICRSRRQKMLGQILADWKFIASACAWLFGPVILRAPLLRIFFLCLLMVGSEMLLKPKLLALQEAVLWTHLRGVCPSLLGTCMAVGSFWEGHSLLARQQSWAGAGVC